jgi:hypothetical protein
MQGQGKNHDKPIYFIDRVMLRLFLNVKLNVFLDDLRTKEAFLYNTILNPPPIDSETKMKSNPRPFDFE